ncbi:MAG: F0F1 ATP synthase subunit gamma [Burkholderiaceae bacterium]
MSDSAAGLRRTISSASDLQSVVRTMKALAASSIGQYEQSVRSLADYARTVELGLSVCLRAVDAPPPAAPASTTGTALVHRLVLVFGSDQGLVGQFNETVAAHVVSRLSDADFPVTVWAVGERVHVRLLDAGIAALGPLAVPQSVKGITALVGRLLLETVSAQAAVASTELLVFHNQSAAGAAVETVQQRLLPLDAHWRKTLLAQAWPTHSLPQVMGGAAETLRALVGEYLFVSLFRACAESLASENASRLAAMERADQNISELLEELRRRFNQLRQSGIDEELFDVISGFEALAPALSAPVQNRSNGAR